MSERTLRPAVVLLTHFEPAGEAPGELGAFKDALGLEAIELQPALPLEGCYLSADQRVLAVLAGVGTANTAISVAALALHPQLDLRSSHWLICGIAGGPVGVVSQGDVVLADWVVDGDLCHHIDSRELPVDWDTGLVPLGACAPWGRGYLDNGLFGSPYQVFELPEAQLRLDARRLAQVPLGQGAQLRVGSVLSAARFWHGQLLQQWAARWVSHWTRGKGYFAAASISNHTAPGGATSAAQSLATETEPAGYSGMHLALKNLAQCGLAQIELLTANGH